MLLSVIIPCYNEEAVLPYFLQEIRRVADILSATRNLSLEFMFINDGSKDSTLKILRQASKEDPRTHYISFSRNFGKESAIYAGLKNSIGDYVVVMDADLQHPPAMIEDMYCALIDKNTDYDVAAARRTTRQGEPAIRSFFAHAFYKIMNKISSTNLVDGATDYRMMTRQVVDSILEMGEYNRFSKGIFGWVGFNTKWIPYENVERVAGETKWSFWKLFLYSLEGIVAFSTAPLAVASVIGILLCLIAFVGIITIVVKTLIWGDPVAGFPTLACLLLLIGGTLQLSLGILGQYLAKIYLETKRRPVYLIKEMSDRDEKKVESH